MRRIGESDGSGLQWFQPDFTGLNQVILGQEVLATLRTAPGQRGLEGLAEAAEGSWTFAQKGFFRRYTEIATAAGEAGRFKGAGDAGSIELPSGKPRFAWTRLSESRGWRTTDGAGASLVEFQLPPRTDVSSRAISARIDVSKAGLELPELPLLVLLMGYLMLRGDGRPSVQLEDTERKLGIFDYKELR